MRLADSVEKVFPDARARRAADAVVDAMDTSLSMRDFLDAWEAKYFEVAGSSPVRRPRR